MVYQKVPHKEETGVCKWCEKFIATQNKTFYVLFIVYINIAILFIYTYL